MIQNVPQTFADRDSVFAIVRPGHVANGHDLEFGFVEEFGGVRPHISKTLNGDTRILRTVP